MINEEKLFTIFNLLRKNKSQLNANQLSVLCYIAKNDGELTATDIQHELNYPKHSSANRICDTLAEGFYYNDLKKVKRFRAGLRFIERAPDLKDSRHKNLMLTRAGKNFISSLSKIIKRNGEDHYEHGQTTTIREETRGLQK